jgi:hypothetical protein
MLNRALTPIFLLVAFSAQARVLDVHSEIRVSKNGDLVVTERVTVEKGEHLERRLPREARVADVIRNGHPETYVLEGERLRLEPVAAPNARQLYQITYRAPRRIAFLGEHDALHWSLAGGERMTAEVILPSSVPARQIKVEASGAAYQSFVRDGRAAFRSEAPIALIVRFPKGVVEEPRPDYFGAMLIVGLLGFTGCVLYAMQRQSARPARQRHNRQTARR